VSCCCCEPPVTLTLLSLVDLGGETLRIGTIDNITMVYPPFPPLTQPELLRADTFCNEHSVPARCNGKEHCPCAHVIKVKRDAIVQLVIVDEQEPAPPGQTLLLNHPFHMHGYQLFVMGMGQGKPGERMTVSTCQDLSAKGLLNISPNRMPPMKDTISIPGAGYTVFRFKADNPGL